MGSWSETYLQKLCTISASQFMHIVSWDQHLPLCATCTMFDVLGYITSVDAFSLISQRCKPAVSFLPDSKYLLLTQLHWFIKRIFSLFVSAHLLCCCMQETGTCRGNLLQVTLQMNTFYFVRFNAIIRFFQTWCSLHFLVIFLNNYSVLWKLYKEHIMDLTREELK